MPHTAKLSSRRSIDLQYYIWHNHVTGRLLVRELLRAADRGVRVRVLLDDINARGQDAAILALDSHPLIDVRIFSPVRNRDGIWRRAMEMALRAVSLNRRMHSLNRRRQAGPRRRTQYRR
ncbi:hypothetical protein [Janthinobacterium sp. LB3P118]|uniref:hypothetical protein n=1 Tax=Janthinobacterium sp. LB3P118 TaxID=3424195 RepID=UPI003F230173